MDYRPVKKSFFSGSTLDIARSLLGQYLVRNYRGNILSGIIVETEAYHEDGDPSCHAHNGMTERNKVMFGPPGHLYVYFTYGMHHCMNVVTENEGTAAAVLIRAVEPVEGIEIMSSLRGRQHPLKNICSGPAKLCRAFGVDKKLNGASLTDDEIWISGRKSGESFSIQTSKRIGISKGVDLPWRFYVDQNDFVSGSSGRRSK